MSLDWIAPVATGAVGISGIIATVLTQRAGRKLTLDLSREQRSQERRQAAYERILLTALKTTEFVEYADLIWERHAMPPDVDTENFDMWILVDLYTTPAFRRAYERWDEAVDEARDLASGLSESARIWDQPDGLPERYAQATSRMRERYNDLVDVVRLELNTSDAKP